MRAKSAAAAGVPSARLSTRPVAQPLRKRLPASEMIADNPEMITDGAAMRPIPDFSTKPVLTGERVLLRPFTAADGLPMAAILADPEVRRCTGGAHLSFDEQRLRTIYAARADATDRLDLAVVDRATGELVGEVVLNQWDAHNRSCVFRTLLGPAGRGRGLGTEATRLIVGHGFEQLGLHRISLFVYAFNPRARRVY
ncbi:RimJ/RimL family protein N-acetyltransferase [Kitasatospora sp. GAS1066B]